jgi:hypothetical protein
MQLTPADYSSDKGGYYFSPGSMCRDDLITITSNDLLITKLQLEKIIEAKGKSFTSTYITGEIKPIPFRKSTTNKDTPTPAHGNSINNARRRENILLALGYVKLNYPDECEKKQKSGKSKPSSNAWAEALLNHWALFGEESDAPTVSYLLPIIRDIYRLPSERKCAGLKNTPKFKNAK